LNFYYFFSNKSHGCIVNGLQAGKYKLAKKYYQKIVDFLKSEDKLSDEESNKRHALLLAGHLNLAMCYLKLSSDVEALQACDEALKLDAKNEKGLFRRGSVCRIWTIDASKAPPS
jgi:FK506-binding protein 4/5